MTPLRHNIAYPLGETNRAAISSSPLLTCQRGIHLRGSSVWFDASSPQEFCFVSHADHARWNIHRRIVMSEPGATLLQWRQPQRSHLPQRPPAQVLAVPFAKRFALGLLDLELFPANHGIGSSSVRIHTAERCIVYAGPLASDGSHSTPALAARPCDVLILSGWWHGRAAWQTLSAEQRAEAALCEQIDSLLHQGCLPILRASLATTAPRLIRLFTAHNVPFVAHPSVLAASALAATRTFDSARFSSPPTVPARGWLRQLNHTVLVWPKNCRLPASTTLKQRLRPIIVRDDLLEVEQPTPATSTPSARLVTRWAQDDMFGFIRACSPKQIVVTGDDRYHLAHTLRAAGWDVHHCAEKGQLLLFDDKPPLLERA